MDEKAGEIKEWTYTTTDGEITIPDEDLVRFAYDADIGEVYGMSFCGKLVHTLHLLLNTELNLAEIVDKFAIPILQWLIEIGDDEELQEDELEGIEDELECLGDVSYISISDDGKIKSLKLAYLYPEKSLENKDITTISLKLRRKF